MFIKLIQKIKYLIFQEGLLDIDLEFSDGSHTALRDVAVSDYFLVVESLDPEVVAFAPMYASRHPRVIAVGEGMLIISIFQHEFTLPNEDLSIPVILHK